jgi:hypothetical protein
MIRRADCFCNNHIRIGRNAAGSSIKREKTRRKFNDTDAFQAVMVTRFAHIGDGRSEGNEHESTFRAPAPPDGSRPRRRAAGVLMCYPEDRMIVRPLVFANFGFDRTLAKILKLYGFSSKVRMTSSPQ